MTLTASEPVKPSSYGSCKAAMDDDRNDGHETNHRPHMLLLLKIYLVSLGRMVALITAF